MPKTYTTYSSGYVFYFEPYHARALERRKVSKYMVGRMRPEIRRIKCRITHTKRRANLFAFNLSKHVNHNAPSRRYRNVY